VDNCSSEAFPVPDFALRLAEIVQRLVYALGDETLQAIADRKLEGTSNDNVAEELNLSTQTIDRKLARIRLEWTESVQQR
jgi:DNA-directed RNA polymerase specialized sigma24 family protein